MEEKGRNSKASLIEWSLTALEEAVEKEGIDQMQANMCHAKALEVIRKGGWRGDVSEAWIKMGFNTADIPDMYS